METSKKPSRTAGQKQGQCLDAPSRLKRLTVIVKQFEKAVRNGDAVPPGGRLGKEEDLLDHVVGAFCYGIEAIADVFTW